MGRDEMIRETAVRGLGCIVGAVQSHLTAQAQSSSGVVLIIWAIQALFWALWVFHKQEDHKSAHLADAYFDGFGPTLVGVAFVWVLDPNPKIPVTLPIVGTLLLIGSLTMLSPLLVLTFTPTTPAPLVRESSTPASLTREPSNMTENDEDEEIVETLRDAGVEERDLLDPAVVAYINGLFKQAAIDAVVSRDTLRKKPRAGRPVSQTKSGRHPNSIQKVKKQQQKLSQRAQTLDSARTSSCGESEGTRDVDTDVNPIGSEVNEGPKDESSFTTLAQEGENPSTSTARDTTLPITSTPPQSPPQLAQPPPAPKLPPQAPLVLERPTSKPKDGEVVRKAAGMISEEQLQQRKVQLTPKRRLSPTRKMTMTTQLKTMIAARRERSHQDADDDNDNDKEW
eukprot:c34679_g1_i1.p1 GENE.c34679_g1_i1~~c34679_g1_i1.p1  ORF type:complete len:396 (+),score=47.82 c34679_g1_i1:1-1188(+)